MFQIDNSSAVAQMPTPSAAGTPGYFTDGNPATGQAATILPAEFMNMVMMELMSIIQAANITPDKTKINQVLSAMDTRYALQSAFGNSQAANGYQKLQGGLILQWGTTPTFTGYGEQAITLPMAFPNQLLLPMATDVGQGAYAYGALGNGLASIDIYPPPSTTSTSVWAARYFVIGI